MQSLNIKERKLLELQITQTRHPLSILQKKMSLEVQDPQKWKKNQEYKIDCALLQCMNNHYSKFEYKGMKTGSNRLHNSDTP